MDPNDRMSNFQWLVVQHHNDEHRTPNLKLDLRKQIVYLFASLKHVQKSKKKTYRPLDKARLLKELAAYHEHYCLVKLCFHVVQPVQHIEEKLDYLKKKNSRLFSTKAVRTNITSNSV